MLYFNMLIILLILNPSRAEESSGDHSGDDFTSEDLNPDDDGNENDSEPPSPEAILDIAFYLRRHRFNGNDMRYRKGKALKLYASFPTPPLKTLHWQVRRHCESSLPNCVKYLHSVINNTALTRKVLSNSKNSMHGAQCLSLQDKDLNSTLRAVPLEHLSEQCNNFGSCEEPFENADIRANDSIPFACAHYSFCPDPCCRNRLLKSLEECEEEPCEKKRSCINHYSANINLEGIMLNQWNISCDCKDDGMTWHSKSGLCVDVDECALGTANCNSESENCFNLPGIFTCVCAFG